MAKKSFISMVKDSVKGAGQTVKDYAHVAKNFAERQDMKVKLDKSKKKKRKTDRKAEVRAEVLKQMGKKEYNKSMEPGALFNKPMKRRRKIEKSMKE